MAAKARKLLKLFRVPSVVIAALILMFMQAKWLRVETLALNDESKHRIVHISDLHYKGDKGYAEKIVQRVNEQSADFVCFTGDIVENKTHLAEALEFIRRIKVPVFGVPGNHEYWSGAPFDEIAEAFAGTGGAWLVDEIKESPDGVLLIVGARGETTAFLETLSNDKPRVLLVHYPQFVERLGTQKFDLILAGHSHGGQVRIPFWGAPILPPDVGEYDLGLFHTPHGPLYVSAGLGTWYLPIRFLCRPEITLIEF